MKTSREWWNRAVTKARMSRQAEKLVAAEVAEYFSLRLQGQAGKQIVDALNSKRQRFLK